jgi:hypothetical protein
VNKVFNCYHRGRQSEKTNHRRGLLLSSTKLQNGNSRCAESKMIDEGEYVVVINRCRFCCGGPIHLFF